ncbi:MAG: hypothetical protein D6772_16995 [Bacteroidetes bacterium]|nr:MAG: hypothetical protein D6772_16995 [Bacteroidota bacterium]
MYRLIFLFSCCLFLANLSLPAQTAIKGIPATLTVSAEAEAELPINDWSIFADQDNKIYFIDFEQFAVNLNEIVVKDQRGQVVWHDEVFDLPVNTIYELDFSTYQAGEYLIELKAYTGVIRKRVQHQS